jgi:hypothetical protein
MTIYRTNSASPWIKQGNRLVKTWPSGLCLIQQDYVAPTALVDYEAFQEGDSIADSDPCIDGAYIFPAPDYQQQENGFTRCTVSAYGRWRTGQHITRQKRELTLGVYGWINNMPIGVNNSTETVYFALPSPPNLYYLNKTKVFAEDLVLKFVVPPNSDLPLTPPLSASRLYKSSGEKLPEEITISNLLPLLGGEIHWQTVGGELVVEGSSAITPAEFESASVGYDSFGVMESMLSLTLTRCESVDFGYFSEYTASFEVGGSRFNRFAFVFNKK